MLSIFSPLTALSHACFRYCRRCDVYLRIRADESRIDLHATSRLRRTSVSAASCRESSKSRATPERKASCDKSRSMLEIRRAARAHYAGTHKRMWLSSYLSSKAYRVPQATELRGHYCFPISWMKYDRRYVETGEVGTSIESITESIGYIRTPESIQRCFLSYRSLPSASKLFLQVILSS